MAVVINEFEVVSEPPAAPAATDSSNPQPQPAMTPTEVNHAV